MTKTPAQIALEALDETARAMEVKWGCGRLPRLVAAIDPDLADKYWSQLEKLNAACEAGAVIDQELHATRMQAAWLRLDRVAEDAGAQPISPKRLEGRLPDGRLLVVVDGPEAAWTVAHEDRAAVVWSIDEVVRMLWSFEMVNDAKTVWPGAKVQQVRVDPETAKPPVDWKAGDDLPTEMLLGAG